VDAKGSQTVALELIAKARQYVFLLAFTFDREDITAELIKAIQRNVMVVIGVDRRWTLSGKCRDQHQQVKRLSAEGAKVRLLDGESLAAHYREAGRVVQGGLGIQHSKVVHTDFGTLIGSCNFTTSSRGNLELGIHVKLSQEQDIELNELLKARIEKGIDVRQAEIRKEQSRSVSPGGSRRSRSSARSAAELEGR
jgi:phosphatidylserine/phosphatidylglycerophosphate/cardiolipin synthase-like enzyme